MLQVKVAVCLDLESGILGPGRFRPGPPNSNNALLMWGIFFWSGGCQSLTKTPPIMLIA